VAESTLAREELEPELLLNAVSDTEIVSVLLDSRLAIRGRVKALVFEKDAAALRTESSERPSSSGELDKNRCIGSCCVVAERLDISTPTDPTELNELEVLECRLRFAT
jgi:hypothetical protein